MLLYVKRSTSLTSQKTPNLPKLKVYKNLRLEIKANRKKIPLAKGYLFILTGKPF